MNIYIATGFENRKRHNECRDLFSRFGVGLTFDWTINPKSMDSLSIEQRADVCVKEWLGVAEADGLVVILPGGRGTHAELGIALHAQIPTWVYRPYPFDRCGSGCDLEVPFYYGPNMKIVNGLGMEDFVGQVANELRALQSESLL